MLIRRLFFRLLGDITTICCCSDLGELIISGPVNAIVTLLQQTQRQASQQSSSQCSSQASTSVEKHPMKTAVTSNSAANR